MIAQMIENVNKIENSRQPAAARRFSFGTSHHWHNGDNNAPLKLNQRSGEMSNKYAESRFTRFSGNVQQLVAHILTGRAITPGIFKDNWRKTDNFIQAQLIAVDFDENVNVSELAAVPFVQQYGLFIHATKRSTAEAPRSRVYFLIDEPITDAAEYQLLALRLTHIISEQLGKKADTQCSDAARRFFGCANAEHIVYAENTVTLVTLRALPPTPKEIEDAENARQRAESRQTAPPADAAYAKRLAYREINRKAEILARTTKGNRNEENRRTAFYAGTFVGAGAIDEHDAYSIVYSAAIAAGRPAEEAEKTTRGGLKKGALTPADIKQPVSRQQTTSAAKTVTKVTLTETPSAGSWWGENVPEVVNEILRDAIPDISAKRATNITTLLNQAIHHGLVNPQAVTVSALTTAAETLKVQHAARTIARGLDEIALGSLFLTKVESIDSIPPNFGKNSTGRPATIYQVQPKEIIATHLLQLASRYLAEKYLGQDILARFTPDMLATLAGEEAASIAAELNDVIAPVLNQQSRQRELAFKRFNADMQRLANGLATPHILQLEPLWAAYDQRAAKARAKLRSAPSNAISQKEWARDLGCTESYVPIILDRAGIQGTPNFDEFPINGSDLQREIRRISFQKRCKVFELRVKDGERYLESRPLSRADTEWVKVQQAQGRQIVAQARLANTYEIVRDEPTPKPERAPVIPVERAPSSQPAAPKLPRLSLKHDYREGHNRRWLLGQLTLAVEGVTGYQSHYSDGATMLIDPSTGEIIRHVESYRDLLAVLWLSRDDLEAQARVEQSLQILRSIVS